MIEKERKTGTVGTMEMEILIPAYVGVMTLPDVAFFPQALMPLHIFEPRYREMLRDALESHRLFAVAGMNRKAPEFEAPHPIATLGIIRACQEVEGGTSNLLLQGLTRVRVCDIVQESPYRIIRIEPLSSTTSGSAESNVRLRGELRALFLAKKRLGGTVPGELYRFLKTIEDPESFVDLAAFNLCDDARLKQRLLETLDVSVRLRLYHKKLKAEVAELKLKRKLQGHLDDDQVCHN